MDRDDKLRLCEQWLAKDYKIDEHTAHRLISNLDIDDIVLEFFHEELEEAEREYEEKQRADYEYNLKYYNDGWSDHEGV